MGESKKKSRKLQAFNYADLQHKLERKCQETNVKLAETSNAYRSQRCSLCGRSFVHKKNRLNGGEELRFKCIKCGYTTDADMNSAKSEAQVANLPPIYVNSNRQNRKRYPSLAKTTGFYWLCDQDIGQKTGEI